MLYRSMHFVALVTLRSTLIPYLERDREREEVRLGSWWQSKNGRVAAEFV